jgi:serpin B
MLQRLLVVLCFACACTDARTADAPPGVVVAKSDLARDAKAELDGAKREKFASDSRAFALALYHELAKQPGNLFFSPYSISTALAMTYAGAKGTTEEEMASALHFSLPQSELHGAFNATELELARRKDQLGSRVESADGFELRLVNQAWGHEGYAFLDSYLDVLARNYGSGMFLVDFNDAKAARRTINDWVSDRTQARIQDLLPDGSLTGNTRLVLTNAIYFKASWQTKFETSGTKPPGSSKRKRARARSR